MKPILKRLLSVAVVASFPMTATAQAPDLYPAFSWESVPVYEMFGDGAHLLTEKIAVRRIGVEAGERSVQCP